VPPELKTAFTTLTSPWSDLTVGRGCGIVGTPPRGSAEIALLVEAQRFDLVRAVMRSANPEGRVYAASEILKLPNRLPSDQLPLRALRESKVSISTCEACTEKNERFDAAIALLR
jgi:hypothetical protein